MAIKIKTDTAPDERKKSAGFKNRSHAVGPEMDAKGGAVPSGGDNPRDEAGATPAELQVAIDTPVDTPSRTFRTRAPNGSFDKLKYQREYHREYRRHQRAKKKAEQENSSE